MRHHTTAGRDSIADPLNEIMHLVGMGPGATEAGWNRESARLFAIDTAVTFLRRHLDVLPEIDRQALVGRLHEARVLVVAGRDNELGFIQAALESHLSLAANGPGRVVWLVAIDSLMPSPYQAALVTTRNSLTMDSAGAFSDLGTLLRDRLTARLGEGNLHDSGTNMLYLSA